MRDKRQAGSYKHRQHDIKAFSVTNNSNGLRYVAKNGIIELLAVLP